MQPVRSVLRVAHMISAEGDPGSAELPAELDPGEKGGASIRGGVCPTTTTFSRRHPTPPRATQRRLTTPNDTFGSQVARFPPREVRAASTHRNAWNRRRAEPGEPEIRMPPSLRLPNRVDLRFDHRPGRIERIQVLGPFPLRAETDGAATGAQPPIRRRTARGRPSSRASRRAPSCAQACLAAGSHGAKSPADAAGAVPPNATSGRPSGPIRRPGLCHRTRPNRANQPVLSDQGQETIRSARTRRPQWISVSSRCHRTPRSAVYAHRRETSASPSLRPLPGLRPRPRGRRQYNAPTSQSSTVIL